MDPAIQPMTPAPLPPFIPPQPMTDGPPVRVIWATPYAEDLLIYMARVSSPHKQELHKDPIKLLNYLAAVGSNRPPHLSPFDMVYACVGIRTSRAIMHQVLRHHSFRFQEFSQRYANPTLNVGGQEVRIADEFPPPFDNKLVSNRELRTEVRLRGATNRQSSLPVHDPDLAEWWEGAQLMITEVSRTLYEDALKKGIANELARNVLPEGLTPTTAYMVGSLRSWVFYFKSRLDEATQKEHRDLARQIYIRLQPLFPHTFEAFFLNPDG